jgi:hypothetical protein
MTQEKWLKMNGTGSSAYLAGSTDFTHHGEVGWSIAKNIVADENGSEDAHETKHCRRFSDLRFCNAGGI